jgi:hypothetical protein
MLSRGSAGIICLAVAAIVLAGCGVATIPDDEIVGLAGTGTVGTGGDLLALSIFGSNGTGPKGFAVDHTVTWPMGSLEYHYTIDYLKEGGAVDEPDAENWDEVILDGSATLIVDLPNLAANHTLTVCFDATEFNEQPPENNDGRIQLDGSSTVTGSANWTNPSNDATASYTMDLTKTWTAVNMDDPSELGWTGYPSEGTVLIVGSIERHRDGPSGAHSGSWEGTILITFDGDEIVPVVVNGREYLLDLSTGKATPAH